MKVLIIWPNSSPVFVSDFWRDTLLYEMEGYLEKNNINVDIYDGTEHNSYEYLFNLLISNKYDTILLNAPLDSMDGFYKCLKYLRLYDSSLRIFVYGFSTLLNRNFFEQLPIDGFSANGEFESSALSFIKGKIRNYNNLYYKDKEEFLPSKVRRQGTDEWSFIKLERALSMPVLRVTISKGCYGGCKFCSSYRLHGSVDRRKKVKEVINYFIKLQNHNYDGIVEFSSPTFTYDKEWVYEFCSEYNKKKLNIKWRCVTRVDCLDEAIIKEMSKSNCTRIGVGIETLNTTTQKEIYKEISKDKILEIINLSKKYKIELLAYLIIGLDKDEEQFIKTFNELKNMGIVPRVTSYVNYEKLDFSDLFDLSIQSDMTTTSLNYYDYISNKKILSIIMGSADVDEK